MVALMSDVQRRLVARAPCVAPIERRNEGLERAILLPRIAAAARSAPPPSSPAAGLCPLSKTTRAV